MAFVLALEEQHRVGAVGPHRRQGGLLIRSLLVGCRDAWGPRAPHLTGVAALQGSSVASCSLLAISLTREYLRLVGLDRPKGSGSQLPLRAHGQLSATLDDSVGNSVIEERS